MTYKIYFDEFCTNFIAWLRRKFSVLYEGNDFMVIDLVHTEGKDEQIVNLIGEMMYESVDSPKWDYVTREIIGLCPWM